jgi:hypothetical protein
MPKELRQVAFRPDEVLTAITRYYQHRNTKLPPGTVVKFVANDAPVSVTLHIQPAEGEAIETTINTETLAAALILSCINDKIPLPADGEKSLRKVGEDGISLFVAKDSRKR